MATELAGKRIFVAGHRGMVGSALVRRLAREDCEIISANRDELDLLDQAAVRRWVANRRPDIVFVAAAKVGGILANSQQPADFLYQNLVIETNIIDSSFRADVEKLLFLGSSCIYPKLAEQPILENALLTGSLESTNQWYAIAKIAGVKLAQAFRIQYNCDYIAAMPTNLYGPGDNFDLYSSHVLPGLINKIHSAKQAGDREVVIWGSGTPMREFMHADDCADACVHLMRTYSNDSHVNVGSGEEIQIIRLAELISEIIGFSGQIRPDCTRPDGAPRKLMSSSLLRSTGWKPTISLYDGIRCTYDWFVENIEKPDADPA